MANLDYSTQSATSEQTEDKIKHIIEPNQSMDDVMGAYKHWAKTFETDVAKSNYTNHAVLAEYIRSTGLVKKEAEILDIGAGTGLHGRELRKCGYSNVDAVEPSQEMMDEAAKESVYRRSIVDFVGTNRLDIEDGSYDVITGAGCFVPSHIGPDAFEELDRILKPGGHFFFVCSQRYYEEQYEGYATKLDATVNDFIEKGLWIQIRKDTIPYLANYNANVTLIQKKI